MADSHDEQEYDAELADQGDDRPGMDEVEGNDYSALLGGADDSDDDYDDDDDSEDDDDLDDEDD